MIVLLKAFRGHLVGEGVVNPRLIGDDHGNAAEGHAEHDLEGQRAGSAVEHRYAVCGIDAGNDDAGIHAEHAEEGHGNDEQRAEEPRAEQVVGPDHHPHGEQGSHREDREDEQRGMCGVVGIQVGVERGQGEENQGYGKARPPAPRRRRVHGCRLRT